MIELKRFFIVSVSFAVVLMAPAVEVRGGGEENCEFPHEMGCALQCYEQWYGDWKCVGACINIPDEAHEVYQCEVEDPEEWDCLEHEVVHLCDYDEGGAN